MKQCHFHPKCTDSRIKLGVNPVMCYMSIMMKTLYFLTFFLICFISCSEIFCGHLGALKCSVVWQFPEFKMAIIHAHKAQL